MLKSRNTLLFYVVERLINSKEMFKFYIDYGGSDMNNAMKLSATILCTFLGFNTREIYEKEKILRIQNDGITILKENEVEYDGKEHEIIVNNIKLFDSSEVIKAVSKKQLNGMNPGVYFVMENTVLATKKQTGMYRFRIKGKIVEHSFKEGRNFNIELGIFESQTSYKIYEK